MSNETVNQIQNQFESTIAGPARTYASLVVNHFEQLANLQFEAARAYSEAGVQQMRAALAVKTPSDVQAYVQNQQQAAKEIGERIKGDVEKVASLNEAFAKDAQKVTEDSAEQVSKSAEEGIKQTSKAAAKSK